MNGSFVPSLRPGGFNATIQSSCRVIAPFAAFMAFAFVKVVRT
jgi:hypothetical protein